MNTQTKTSVRTTLARRVGAVLRPLGLDQTVRRWYDTAPTWTELRHPVAYARAARIWKQLREEGFTLTEPRRGRTLNRLAQKCDRAGIPGALVDCGCYNGGSSVMMSTGAPSREVWAFDSFEGLPEATDRDPDSAQGWAGVLRASEDRVQEGFERFASLERLQIVKGWFEDTFPSTAPKIDQVAVLNADGDWYDSVWLTLETFYPKVVPGGFVVIDDYNHWEGAKTAADEYRAAQAISARLVEIDTTGVYWQKPRAG